MTEALKVVALVGFLVLGTIYAVGSEADEETLGGQLTAARHADGGRRFAGVLVHAVPKLGRLGRLEWFDRTGQSLALAQCLRVGGCIAVLQHVYQNDPAWDRPTDPALEERASRARPDRGGEGFARLYHRLCRHHLYPGAAGRLWRHLRGRAADPGAAVAAAHAALALALALAGAHAAR